MIKLTNLQKIYRTKEIETVALEKVNLEVQQGEFLSILLSNDTANTEIYALSLLDALPFYVKLGKCFFRWFNKH